MNIYKNLKGAVGFCLAVMLMLSSCCFAASAQGEDPAPQTIDDRDVTWFEIYANGITPWVTVYCDPETQAFADYQAVLQKAKEVAEKTGTFTQRQIDEIAAEFRRAYLALDIVVTEDQYIQFVNALEDSFYMAKNELGMTTPAGNHITRASHGYVGAALDKFEFADSNNLDELIEIAKELKEALTKVEVNRVDYSRLNEFNDHKEKDIDPNAGRYTKTSFNKFMLAYHYWTLQFENIPTQDEFDGIIAGLEQAEQELILKGDCDRDGTISVRDVTSVQKDLADIDKLCEEACDAADVNGDGVVNTQDILLTQRYIAKSIDMFPGSDVS